MIKKILLGLVAVIVVAVVALFATVSLRWDRTFDVPYPELAASTDSATIARGRYLAYGPAHCAACHVPLEDFEAFKSGGQPPLAGGRRFVIPPGTFNVPNITPDPETGLGDRSDAAIARMLRHGVRADGRAAVPFMEFAGLSDSDVVAVIAFLRSQPPVRHVVPAHQLTTLGKAVMAFAVKPFPPHEAPGAAPPEGPTAERGVYLVKNVAGCGGCHTARSMVDGSFIGPELAGGVPMELEGPAGGTVTPPNLTPDPKTGRITTWSEDDFLARFRAGERVPGSPMPWLAFGRMSDDDLRAIYRYLRSVPAVEHEPGAKTE